MIFFPVTIEKYKKIFTKDTLFEDLIPTINEKEVKEKVNIFLVYNSSGIHVIYLNVKDIYE